MAKKKITNIVYGTPEYYRDLYNRKKESEYGYTFAYDPNMEYREYADVKNGSWILITRTIPVMENVAPKLYGIYWGVPKQDKYDRQCCVVHTTEDVTLLNHEYTVLSKEDVKRYREEGYELHEILSPIEEPLNLELIEKGKTLCEEEREIIWALQLDGLTEIQACEEYFLSKHTDYSNSNIYYYPNEETLKEIFAWFGERR